METARSANAFLAYMPLVFHSETSLLLRELLKTAKCLSSGEEVESIFFLKFIGFCNGDMKAYYFHEVLLRNGLLESATSEFFAAAQFTSSNSVFFLLNDEAELCHRSVK
jgi:hypothetical protein